MDLQIKPLTKPVSTSISIPGSKSYTNRSLILATLTKGRVVLRNPLYSDDTFALINCLKILGIKIKTTDNQIEVSGDISKIQNKNFDLNCKISGTTIRFILALSCIIPGTKKIYGDERLNERPIKELIEGLRQLGAEIEYLENEGFPPFIVKSSKLNPGIVKLKGDVSSQFFSAILMVSPLIGNVQIEVAGDQISKPYIDMTIDTMEKFGVKVKNKNYRKYIVSGNQKYSSKEYLIEGDYSSAGYFFAIAALSKSNITVKNLNPKSKQADIKFLKILEKMGNKIIKGRDSITVKGIGITPLTVDMQDFPDQAQTLAVIASFATGKTVINGIRSLRVKETERVKALETELLKIGIKTESSNDQLVIYGGSPKSANIKTYSDHRMAMSFAVAGAILSGMIIENAGVVTKTFPDFWEKLNSIGIKTEIATPPGGGPDAAPRNDKANIVLIGMRGSGKTTIAKLLSRRLERESIDIDKLIRQKLNLTVPEIVSKYGWEFFRKKESEITREISALNNIIISTGGGVILNPLNIKSLKENGVVVYLSAAPEILFERIGIDKNRPALLDKKNPLEELKEIFKQRKNLYESAADYKIDTDGLNLKQITEKIISIIFPENKKKCMVIGDPIEHSLSPLLHNTGYKALGIDKEFVYKKELVRIENLGKFIDSIKNSNIRGVSLTMPHKLEVMKYIDNIDNTAMNIGAVNTIVNENGKLYGFNTDWLGVILPLEKITILKNKEVAVIGAGGAARAAIFGFIKSGSKVTIYNRTIDKARALANEFNCKFSGMDNLEDLKKMDIIFNATSLGTGKDISISPLPENIIQKHHIIFDAIYSPSETQLIKNAKNKDATIIYGSEMLLYQGIKQFELFTGKKAPVKQMLEALEKNIK